MVEHIERPKFVRVEGFFDEQQLEILKTALGETAIQSSTFLEVQTLRDRDEYGPLLAFVPGAELVVTKSILVSFSKRLPSDTPRHPSDGLTKMQGRAARLFDSLHYHVMKSHGENLEPESKCECSLRGGRFQPGYLDPLSLVVAFEQGEIDRIPSYTYTFTKTQPKPLREAACYSVLPPYVDALSR